MHPRLVRVEHEIANVVLCVRITVGAEQREVAFVTVYDELPRREGHVSAGSVASLPHGKAHELETGEVAADKVNLCIRELAHWRRSFVDKNLDFNVHDNPRGSGPG